MPPRHRQYSPDGLELAPGDPHGRTLLEAWAARHAAAGKVAAVVEIVGELERGLHEADKTEHPSLFVRKVLDHLRDQARSELVE